MQKSKSWLKVLLIAVMAVVLVFSLVACNKDNVDGPVIQETSADYFTALWNSTKPIGTAAIEDGADLAVGFGVELSIDTFDEMAGAVYHQIDLGLNVQAVIGRTEATSGNTAVKISLYDPSDSKNKEILTFYAFADDLDNLYIDFAGKNIKLPHNLESNLFEKGAAGKAIANLLKDKVEIGGQEKSFNEIIDLVTKSFGSNWDLNSLIDSVLTLVGFDANKIFSLIREMDGGSAIEALIKNLFGVNSLEDLLENGKIDILKILTADALSEILPATKQKLASGATVHRADLSGILSMFIGRIPVIGGDVKDMLGGGELSLAFSEKGGAIQDFTVYAQLMGLQQEEVFNDAKGNPHTLTPELSLKIKDLSIKQLASDKSNGISIAKDKYSDTVAFDETLELAASGIQINKLDKDGKDISLNGKIIVNSKGVLDIVNTKAVIAADATKKTVNKTKANITVQLVNGTDAPVTLAQISYANGKIAGTVDGIDLGLINKAWSGKTGFVYDLGADFNVADFVQDHIASFIEGFFPDETAEVSADEANRSLTQKINHILSPEFGNALNLLTTPNNHLHIEIANILQTVVNIKECVVPGGDNAWNEANRIEAITNTLTNPPYADKSIDQCVDILKQQMEILKGDEKLDKEAMKELTTACKNAAFRILYLVAQNVRIEGVATKDSSNKDLSEIEIYKNNIKAVLGAEIVVDGDLQGGIHASISVKIADATLSVSTSFELVENANFFDLYETYTNASDKDKANWVVITPQQNA